MIRPPKAKIPFSKVSDATLKEMAGLTITWSMKRNLSKSTSKSLTIRTQLRQTGERKI
jgi:hypothetical protein